MIEKPYDAIIIGAGQAGLPLGTALAGAGWRTALVEREHLGGTCVNEGCTPTKTMAASARVAYLARRAGDYGVNTPQVCTDMERVRARKRAVVSSFRSGAERRVSAAEGLDWLQGEARFSGPKTLEVQLASGGVQILSAEYLFINAGSRPVSPPIPGLDEVPSFNSTTIMELGEVPEHLLVIGGGYIGVEFGQMFRRFGSEVTVIQHGPQLLGREDKDVAAEVAKILEEDGLKLLCETATLNAEKNAQAGITLTLKGKEGERQLTGSHLLVATGRAPNSDRLTLAAAGIETDGHGFIRVNDRLETNVQGVYALGDIKGGPAFTHISYDDYRIIRSNLLEDGKARLAGRLVPYTVFIDPQLGRIGLSEQDANAQGLNYRVAKLPMSYVARALELDEARGFMKAVIDAESQEILGFVAFGFEGGELASMVQIAMLGHLPYTALRDAVFPHPGLAEGFNTLFSLADSATL